MPVPLPTKVFESRSFLLRATAGIDRKALCWDRLGVSPAHLYEAGENCAAMVAEFERISSDGSISAARTLVQSAVTKVRSEVGRVALDNGLA